MRGARRYHDTKNRIGLGSRHEYFASTPRWLLGLVRNGWAFEWPRYSKGRYTEAQREAEYDARGM
ncbi:hypothetical protein V1283_000326 [Bradyrhizobium sp. AZCC 2262]